MSMARAARAERTQLRSVQVTGVSSSCRGAPASSLSLDRDRGLLSGLIRRRSMGKGDLATRGL